MHFGEPLDDERLAALLRPDERIDTVITADAYGAGEADALLGRALAGLDRDALPLVGAIGHDFYTGEREGAKGFPRFTDPRLRGPDGYADYIRMATERSLERVGAGALRPPAPAQPRPHRLHEPGRLGGDARRPRRGPGRRDRRRARAGERLHARPHRLLRALRRADRVGDGDPQPARAVAGRARPARRARARRQAHHARRRLRRPVLGRRPARPRVRAARPPRLPPRRVGRGRPRAPRADAAGRRARTG